MTVILTGDIHLRDDQPTCWTEDFFEYQFGVIQWLKNLADAERAPVFDSGDLFHKWRSSPFLLGWAIKHMPPVITVPGNHDLPQHNLGLYKNSSLAVLEAAHKARVFTKPDYLADMQSHWKVFGCPWGTEVENIPKPDKKDPKCRNILLLHIMTYGKEKPWEGLEAIQAKDILKQLYFDGQTGYDLIVTGHNHQTFTETYKGCVLVNPGSLTVQTADQVDHKPGVFLWEPDTNKIVFAAAPAPPEGAITRDHIDKKENRDDRITTFIERLDGEFEVGLSFERNVENFFSQNEVPVPVQRIVWEAVRGR